MMMSEKILSIEELKQESSNKEFELGSEFYQKGKVKNVVRVANVFMAIVVDTDYYNVELDIDMDPKFTCDCPSERKQLCRHKVALGYAIINGQFTEKPEQYPDDSDIELPEDFLKSFGLVKNVLKIEFLLKLFTKNVDLRHQFQSFIESKNDAENQIDINGKDKTPQDIDEARAGVAEFFGNIELNFNIDSGEYDYYYHGTGFYDEGFDMLKSAMSLRFMELTSLINHGKLRQAFTKLLGLYEGSFNLVSPTFDNVPIFDDYSATIQEIIADEIKKYSDNLSLVVKTDEMVIDALNLFIDRYLEILGRNDKEDEAKIVYEIKLFSSLIHSLITSPVVAAHLIQKIYRKQLVF